MSRIARFAVLVTALASLLGIMSSAASAVTWHNTGSTSFTATGGPGTLSRGSVSLACTGSSATGTAPGGSTVATNYTVSGTITFSPCTLSGQNTYVHCTYTLTGTAFAAGVTAGSAGVTCVARLTATNTALCHIEGSTPGSYTNPSGATAGKVTINASNTLTVTNSSSPCPLGTGSGALTHQTITVTGGSPTSLGPVINRTA
jgi:hypothetical protein